MIVSPESPFIDIYRGSYLAHVKNTYGVHMWLSSKEYSCQCRRCRRGGGLHPWVGKISLKKEMVTHSSILAWESSWAVEPRGLQSVGLQRAGHDWSNREPMHTWTLMICYNLIIVKVYLHKYRERSYKE